ncbi:hypothetical protein LCGC14_0693760 [marine sediment metagenome]|uniref:RNA ligase domain-containing protein n=1 Tax=marine sediment metagenome TaxID=412755 RepID=A0A0F9QJV5_9ZZZZ
MSKIRSYSSPLNLGHAGLKQFWGDEPVTATEKIDGSQFSFALMEGELACRSRNAQIDLEDPGMFKLGVQTVLDIHQQGLLHEGWVYRGEYLSKPEHNTMAYDRVPRGNIMLFDIDRGDQDYLASWAMLESEANFLDLECVPRLITFNTKPTIAEVTALLDVESVLGGGKIEGLVLKNYSAFGRDGKVLMAKMVSKDFRERHSKGWKERNPGQGDFIVQLTQGLATEARWMKAVQHLREAGELEGVPQDIPLVMREIVRDVEEEHAGEVRDELFAHFWPQIKRGVNRGAAEWYKALLAEESL